MNRKSKKLATSFLLQVFSNNDVSMVEHAVFPGCSSLTALTYSGLADVQKLITLRPFIVLVCVNNLWKEERVVYNYCIGLPDRFQTCQRQN
jgi:hypothetical protein